MIEDGVRPYASLLWQWGKNSLGANLIAVDKQTLTLCLLPRTKGRFTRKGLVVNKLRYRADGFTEHFLKGGECTVAYSTDDVSTVWLIDSGSFTPFSLVLSGLEGLSLEQTNTHLNRNRAIVRAESENNIKARLDLIQSIEVITNNAQQGVKSISNIRTTRATETKRKHIDYIGDIKND